MPGAPSLSSTGKVVYTLNTPYRDGTTQVAFDPVDFMARLAALVPKLLDDMEPLAGLAMLQYLRLDGNGIADITPLV